jgi:hypothetical protein
MQTIRPRRFNVAIATAGIAIAGTLAVPHAVWEVALHVCAKTIDFAYNVTELPCRIAESIRTLPERMDPTRSECNEP